jgi:signal transduction histidine kinase
LAIAKKFTEAYGGTISVSSRLGAGAVFRVTFPAYVEA